MPNTDTRPPHLRRITSDVYISSIIIRIRDITNLYLNILPYELLSRVLLYRKVN